MSHEYCRYSCRSRDDGDQVWLLSLWETWQVVAWHLTGEGIWHKIDVTHSRRVFADDSRSLASRGTPRPRPRRPRRPACPSARRDRRGVPRQRLLRSAGCGAGEVRDAASRPDRADQCRGGGGGVRLLASSVLHGSRGLHARRLARATPTQTRPETAAQAHRRHPGGLGGGPRRGGGVAGHWACRSARDTVRHRRASTEHRAEFGPLRRTPEKNDRRIGGRLPHADRYAGGVHGAL